MKTIELPVNILVQLLWHIVAARHKVRNLHQFSFSKANHINEQKKTSHINEQEKKIAYLTTCITLGMSSPLAATAVATRIGILPVLKSSKAW